jgi:hypothetical protein
VLHRGRTHVTQSDLRNSVTFGVGYGRDVNAFCCQTGTAVSLDATYGYRIWPFLQVEAGLATALNPLGGSRGDNYNVQPDNRSLWVPFGVRGILPLHSNRVELSLVAGQNDRRFVITGGVSFRF